MNEQLHKILQKRAAIISTIADQREQISQTSRRLDFPINLIDKGINAVKYIRSHPLIVVGFFAVLAIKRSGVINIASYAWRIWKFYRSAKTFSNKVIDRL